MLKLTKNGWGFWSEICREFPSDSSDFLADLADFS